MRTARALLAALALAASAAAPALGFEPRQGCLLAERACPAPASLRDEAPPGTTLEPGRAYRLLGANRARASHLQIRIPEASPPDRWVAADCGRTVAACPAPGGPEPGPEAGTAEPASHPLNLLALSWQPAFCEGRPERPECASQTGARHDATNLALHGLWPQPQERVYCGVGAREEALDREGRWSRLPPVELAPATRAALAEVMPGARSGLDRHEWIKHGTCYSRTAEEYYRESIQLVRELNAGPVRELLASRIGERVTLAELRAAFDAAFGKGAGARVAMDCERLGGRLLVAGLKLSLAGEITPASRLADLLAAAPPVPGGCRAGEIDPAGPARGP